MRRRDIDEELDWGFNPKFPDYEFSEIGDVWDRINQRYLKISYPTKGSPVVNLRDKYGEPRTYILAKVILEAFRGFRDSSYQVYYLDGNKRNVCIDNLKWRYVQHSAKEKREWVNGHPEIPLSEYYRNTYIRVKETGIEYDNIWAFISITGEKESVAKRCMREPYATTSKGHHIIPIKYEDSCVTVDLEDNYE